MKKYRWILAGVIVVLALAGCGGSAGMRGAASQTDSAVYYEEAEGEAFFADDMAMDEAGFAAPAEAPMPSGIGGGGADTAFVGDGDGAVYAQQERLIIRTGNLSIEVEDTLARLEDVATLAENAGGFVVTSNTYQQYEGAYYGDITIRVPSESFDQTMDAIKALAVEVQNENVFGQDVTEEFVDLEARLGNLQAAEEQLQEIMDNAQDTDDVITVFNQLTQIRGEIESIQGRMQYLSESARLSTITVSLYPSITSQPVDVRWRPGETIKLAVEQLGRTMADVADFLINFVIVGLPVLLVFALVVALLLSPFYFGGRALIRRRRRKKQESEN